MSTPEDFAKATAIVDPAGLDCVLAAGDSSDIAALQSWLDMLPSTAYGQVFLEVFTAFQRVDLCAPPGVNVTWLFREQRATSTRPGLGQPRGQALATAVDGWLDEWFRVTDDERHICIWAGARSSSVMNRYWLAISQEITARFESIERRRSS